MLAVTGRNGSGKSTLLKIIAGVLTPDAGTIHLARTGIPMGDEQRVLNFGMVAPYLNLYEELSAIENLLFLARARSLTSAQNRIERLIRHVGLEARGRDAIHTYSSGMKQRVKYAAAMLSDPPVLLLDEPSSNLDAQGLDMLGNLTQDWLSEGKIVVVATNDDREASQCSHVLDLHDFL
jgi:heme exporter protein A